MSELNLPSEDELDLLDFDDFYDEVEAYIKKTVSETASIRIVVPSISHDDLLANANALIPLREKQQRIKTAFDILEEELDTGHLQNLAAPFIERAQKLLQALKSANEMTYLLDEIKITRKKSKRVSKKLARLRSLEGLAALQSEADELRGLADFSSRIEDYRNKGFNVDGLIAAHKQMDSQIDKTQDAFDSKIEELNELS